MCGVYTAFAFDKVNQKFFNPFCIQANIDRHTHTHRHIHRGSYIRPKRDHQPACLPACLSVCAHYPVPLWAWSHFECPRPVQSSCCKVNFINAKLYVFIFLERSVPCTLCQIASTRNRNPLNRKLFKNRIIYAPKFNKINLATVSAKLCN